MAIGYLGSQYSLAFGLWLQQPGSDYQFGWLLLPVILMVEAVVFGLFGTTLGKAILGVQVISIGGSRPTFGQYLKRQLGVYWYGLGTGFPLVILFTMARQSGHLRGGKQVTYDRGKFNVKAPKLGVMRAGFAMALVAAVFAVNVAFQHIANKSERKLAVEHAWTNEVTGNTVQLPAGWMHEERRTNTGEVVRIFSAPQNNIVAVFANEDTGDLPVEDYAQLWRGAVAEDMEVGEVTASNAATRNAWIGRGRMVDDRTRQLTVALVPRGEQVWRVILIGVNGTSPDSAEALKLRDVLLASL